VSQARLWCRAFVSLAAQFAQLAAQQCCTVEKRKKVDAE